MDWLGVKHGSPVFFARILLQLLLLSLFLHFFGLPAIQKYREKRTIMVESRRFDGGMPSPAITIEARNPKSLKGWRDPTAFQNGEDLEALCRRMNNGNTERTIEGCIQEETYDRMDVSPYAASKNLKSSQVGKWNVFTDNFWSEGFNKIDRGRIFTLYPNQVIKDRLQLRFNSSLVYKLRIHDPNFFVITTNPKYIPVLTKSFFPNNNSLMYNMFVTEVSFQ